MTAHENTVDLIERASSLFERWRGARGILLAVSGGPDSMALLALLARWRETGNAPELFAATVDHCLRAEAADEAQMVSNIARSLALPHAVLKWEHEGVNARVQEQARAARYELLLTHAKQIGANVLMTAHHSDDQAETILFRLLRGSGLAGLSGMAKESPRGDVQLARPLLEVRKRELVALCKSQNISYCEDPSNEDHSYARSRMRNILPLLQAEGMDAAGWSRLARRMARAEAALARLADDTARSFVISEDDRLALDFDALARHGDEIGLRVVNLCVERLTGARPRLERAESLFDRLQAARQNGAPFRANIGGVQFSLNQKGLLHLARESARNKKPTQTD